jgi:hypothetical protein
MLGNPQGEGHHQLRFKNETRIQAATRAQSTVRGSAGLGPQLSKLTREAADRHFKAHFSARPLVSEFVVQAGKFHAMVVSMAPSGT